MQDLRIPELPLHARATVTFTLHAYIPPSALLHSPLPSNTASALLANSTPSSMLDQATGGCCYALCMGRRRHSHRKLGRAVTQIRVLCALAFSWILLMFGMITQNVSDSVCGRWYGDTCGLFTSAHVLSWILILTLLLAAYATYRRAVTIHGVVMVPLPAPPPMVPAWHLSGVTDGEGSKVTEIRPFELDLEMEIVRGKDVWCIIETGMGKTAVLQAGAIAADTRGECGICLIIVPTKVLVEQQAEVARK
ncbi:hypothetical protein B0H13DRAFT_2659873 [Mycena leptocephala]|nr:hypothetical protein B0H13DRAFT_2659873 [Mycena leptocephala]